MTCTPTSSSTSRATVRLQRLARLHESGQHRHPAGRPDRLPGKHHGVGAVVDQDDDRRIGAGEILVIAAGRSATSRPGSACSAARTAGRSRPRRARSAARWRWSAGRRRCRGSSDPSSPEPAAVGDVAAHRPMVDAVDGAQQHRARRRARRRPSGRRSGVQPRGGRVHRRPGRAVQGQHPGPRPLLPRAGPAPEGPRTGRRCPRDSGGVSIRKLSAPAPVRSAGSPRTAVLTRSPRRRSPRNCDSRTPTSPTTTPVNRAGASMSAAAAATSSTVTAASATGWSRSHDSSRPDAGEHRQRRGQPGLGGQRRGQGAEGVVAGRLDLVCGRRQQADPAELVTGLQQRRRGRRRGGVERDRSPPRSAARTPARTGRCRCNPCPPGCSRPAGRRSSRRRPDSPAGAPGSRDRPAVTAGPDSRICDCTAPGAVMREQVVADDGGRRLGQRCGRRGVGRDQPASAAPAMSIALVGLRSPTSTSVEPRGTSAAVVQPAQRGRPDRRPPVPAPACPRRPGARRTVRCCRNRCATVDGWVAEMARCSTSRSRSPSTSDLR